MRERYEKAQAFLENLSQNSPELPFEPSLLPELFASTSERSVKPTDSIAALVERSQGLAARILRQANSAYYGIQTEVSSLSHAIRLLGLNELRNMIVKLGISSALRQLPLPKEFPFEKLWAHQLFTANIARNIARDIPRVAGAITPDELYAAGLLHDMGKTMLAALCPADWAAIHDLALCESIPFSQAEENYWGLDHSVVGARLLTFWGIPSRLTELVNWHHSPQLAKPDFHAPACLLATANLLAHNLDVDDIADIADEKIFTVPEAVVAVLPGEIDREKLQQSFASSCDLERVRGMAKTAMDL